LLSDPLVPRQTGRPNGREPRCLPVIDLTDPEILTVLRTLKASELLLWLRRNDVRLDGFPADLSPLDVEEAYEIQSTVARLRGVDTRAFRITMTSTAAQKKVGATTPIFGRLARADILRSPARILTRPNHLRVVDADVVFEIGKDLPAERRPFTQQDVLNSVRGAYPGIVVSNSRFHRWSEISLRELIADNVYADQIVVGEVLPPDSCKNLSSLTVTMDRPGRSTLRGSTAKVAGGPLKSLTWLANWLGGRGEGLKRGQLVATGGCTAPTEISATGSAFATFGTDTKVCVEFASE
jgi:2-keto-4-pentenoate hydratase